MNTGRIVRLAERDRPEVRVVIDGETCSALAGDTVLTAMLASGLALRNSEFGPEPRAGFCLMGACQDCWVWQEEGPRLRTCSTPVIEGMRLRTTPRESWR
ncbi:MULTISPECIES: (2Fe-2S)-binding protein [unclassified Mesorhizobium]|uniref:(2Fe-2S)-binding protein n=1 Tax=unclassified Mesorhizobium TaxID=325217 RepID=UPI002417B8D3|nr:MULTISPECIES: (2Fe-2S)-binding protein [unclassified Mesorhizobium]WFP65719.1 (2Fe-2S)-binding protein [Mesorhizobium sp. WSM4904]WFP78981.1 (2Fe-2S)-binding protein [Mesorhizobium sp. WSM4906]